MRTTFPQLFLVFLGVLVRRRTPGLALVITVFFRIFLGHDFAIAWVPLKRGELEASLEVGISVMRSFASPSDRFELFLTGRLAARREGAGRSVFLSVCRHFDDVALDRRPLDVP